ncbi:MAG: TldD/PmbA family protein [candidate division WOR-3 bacterium]|nr:TldD/PmbA family protein [candidate division WOR-3 bacterium]MCX7837165.1 TldD/PmbA family protein [candidate division WOR-3 bacterium]MDW8114188.1 TldD/PmbA family protein [candidate division WOR-3 bacterium]
MVIEDLKELLKDKGVIYDIFYEKSHNESFKFRGDEPYSSEKKEKRGVGLRVVKNGKIGFSSTSDFSKLKELVDTALTLSFYGEKVDIKLPLEKDLPEVKTVSNKTSLIKGEKLFSMGEEMISLIKEKEPEVKIDLSIEKEYYYARLVNSEGFDSDYEKIILEFDLSGLLVLEDGLIWFYDFYNLSENPELDLKKVSEEFSQLIKVAKKRVKINTGEYKIILMPLPAAYFFSILFVGANGKQLEKKSTPLIDKEGKEIAPSFLNIIDDGTYPFGFNTSPFDGDGIKRRKTKVIENGVFCNFLFDLTTAKKLNRESTGNGERSYEVIPTIQATNIYIEPSKDYPLARIIKEIKDGIIVYYMLGGGQSNVLAGEFNWVINLGFKIEDGEIIGRIKDCMFAGNLYEYLNKIILIGSEIKDLGNYFVPPIVLDKCKIVSKE